MAPRQRAVPRATARRPLRLERAHIAREAGRGVAALQHDPLVALRGLARHGPHEGLARRARVVAGDLARLPEVRFDGAVAGVEEPAPARGSARTAGDRARHRRPPPPLPSRGGAATSSRRLPPAPPTTAPGARPTRTAGRRSRRRPPRARAPRPPAAPRRTTSRARHAVRPRGSPRRAAPPCAGPAPTAPRRTPPCPARRCPAAPVRYRRRRPRCCVRRPGGSSSTSRRSSTR